MKKTLLFALTLLLAVGFLKAQCPSEIVFTTQAQIDNFSIDYPNCTALPGDLIIEGEGANLEITNLTGLSQLDSIGGDLELNNNNNLTSLAGLEGLQTIGGGLYIQNNSSLVDISAFASLGSVGMAQFGQTLRVENNESLTSLSVFSNTTFLQSNFHIIDNIALVNLTGLEQIVSPAILHVTGNAALGSLEGLNNLIEVSHFEITNNVNLTSLSALESLTNVGIGSSNKGLSITGNPSLVNLTGLESLTTIDGILSIRTNELLVDLTGLSSLTSVSEDFIIHNNDLMTSLAGLASLVNIGNLRLTHNDILASLQTLSNINTITGFLQIADSDLLLNLSGLEWITELESLTLKDNEILSNISALSNLSHSGYVTIENNDALTSLAGLENLTSIPGNANGSIRLGYNDALTDISALNPSGTISSLLIIENNVLPVVAGFPQIDSIIGYCFIQSNAQLTEISGFNNVKVIGIAPVVLPTDLSIAGNNSLVNITGFNNLKTLNGKLWLLSNPLLNSISGFHSLDSILGGFQVTSCTALADFLELTALTFLAGDVSITANTSLSICEFPALCNYVLDGGVPEISNNAGCATLSDLLLVCFEENTIVAGSVILDFNQNCINDNSEPGASNWLLNASNANYSFTISTDSIGNYWIPLLAGDWYFNFISPSSFWSSCFADSLMVSTGLGDTLLLDGIITPQADCPYLDWGISYSELRVCQSTNFVIDYCNYGTQPAIDHIFSVALEEYLYFEDADFPYTIDSDSLIHFTIDSIGLFECGQITFSAFVDCDEVELGDFLCLEVALSPDDLCSSNAAWDESTITTSGYCANDSIFFELENIGIGNMAQPTQFKVEIVIDDIVMMQEIDDYQLMAGELLSLSYGITGTELGMRLETNQSPQHPVGGTISMVVPNCNNDSNNVVLNLLPIADNGHPFYEEFCAEVTGAFDPNIKSALPIGLGEEHEIDKSWKLDYTIQFQNTGNDTAFLVVLKDTLSEHLDLSTIKVRGASHDFYWNLNPDRELVFTFENILLVDSFTNEPGSHGFVHFEIAPKADLFPGDRIENRAGIYFDFNDPIITNIVYHTIRKPIIGSSEHAEWCAGEEYGGFEISQDTAFQQLTEFIEYDSIHFVHLDVNPISESMILTEVVIGETINDVLITGDTIFTTTLVNYLGCDSLVTYTISALTNTADPTALEKIKVFPNPVSDQLQVLDHQSDKLQEWIMVNNIGQVVWEKTLLPKALLTPIDLKNFPAGLYWLKLNTAANSAVWRIVKY